MVVGTWTHHQVTFSSYILTFLVLSFFNHEKRKERFTSGINLPILRIRQRYMWSEAGTITLGRD
jgi:hypothetical protein